MRLVRNVVMRGRGRLSKDLWRQHGVLSVEMGAGIEGQARSERRRDRDRVFRRMVEGIFAVLCADEDGEDRVEGWMTRRKMGRKPFSWRSNTQTQWMSDSASRQLLLAAAHKFSAVGPRFSGVASWQVPTLLWDALSVLAELP